MGNWADDIVNMKPHSPSFPVHQLPHSREAHALTFSCLYSAVTLGHEERAEVRGEEDGPTEDGPSQWPVGVQATDLRRRQGRARESI